MRHRLNDRPALSNGPQTGELVALRGSLDSDQIEAGGPEEMQRRKALEWAARLLLKFERLLAVARA
jgi:hypothetical protein